MQDSIPIRVVEVVKSIDADAKVVLFGSRARGEAGEESDWDFLVLVSRKVSPELADDIRDRLYYLELECEQVISTVIDEVV